MKKSIAFCCLLVLAVAVSSVHADFQGKGKKGLLKKEPQGQSTGEEGKTLPFQPSGLVPVFAAGASCAEVASPFGSPTRYDGSLRPMNRFGGRHGGIDLTLTEGTPLRAMAKGTIIHMGDGSQMEGNFVWLQFAPADTGLPFWVYAKYQHLKELSTHAIGAVLHLGDIVGPSGKTGTMGGHYGADGYPHLHLTVYAAPSEHYALKDTKVAAEAARIFDPVALFLPGLRSLDDLNNQTAGQQKQVPIPCLGDDGAIHPPGSRLIWPVACTMRQ